MEMTPNDNELSPTEQLSRDYVAFSQAVIDGEGHYAETVVALAELIQKQFGFAQADAYKFVRESGVLTTGGEPEIAQQQAAAAPLYLMDFYFESCAGALSSDSDESGWSERLVEWYMYGGAAVQRVAARAEHNVDVCCEDDACNLVTTISEVCAVSSACPQRALRNFLLQPAQQREFSDIYDVQDEYRHHAVTYAKLDAALACGFIDNQQLVLLDDTYIARVEQWRKG